MLSLASNLRSLLPAPRASATPGPLDPFWYQPAQMPGPSGIVVKPDNGMKVGPAYACIRVLRECLGSLPWKTYERLPGQDDQEDNRPDPDHYLWPILLRRPNSWQTPIEFKEMGVTHVCLRGNFYAHIEPSPDQEFALRPLNPDKMQVDQLPDWSLRYTYSPKPGIKEIYPAAEIFHVRGLSLNGITGVSVLEYASLTMGLSIAQQTHGASLFRNGGLPTFWIKRPQGVKWTKDAIRNFRSGWKKLHAGPENAGNPPILQDGMELHELSLTNRDSQWLESLAFNAVDICRFFGVPPHMIGIHGQEPADIEQTGIEFVRFTLHPLACRFEQAADRDLLIDPETHYTRFHLDELQRGSMLNRYSAHNIGVQGGWKLPNEVRREEGLNPIEGGDEPRFPMNMQPAGGGPDWNEQGGPPGKGKKKPKKRAASREQDEEDDDLPGGRKDDDGQAMDGDKDYARLKAGFQPILEDAAQRIAAAEIRTLSARAVHAESDRAKYSAWAVDYFAGERRKFVHRVLNPLLIGWGREIALPESLFAMPAELAEAPKVSALLYTWELQKNSSSVPISVRAHQILAQLSAAFFTDTSHLTPLT